MRPANGPRQSTRDEPVPATMSPGMRRGARSWRRTFSSFRNRNYRLFWFGQLVSVTGTWVQRIGQAWLVLQLTESEFALGLVTALQFLPLTIFSLFGGVVADRLPKRRVLIATQLLMALQGLTLALLISSGQVQIWHIYALALLLGLATAFDNPTRQAFVIELVGPDDVPNAVALNSSVFNAARILGPALGGWLIAAFGLAGPFYVNAVSYLAVIGGLLLMRAEHFHAVPPPTRGPVLARLHEGIAYAVRTPEVALVLILMGFLGTFGYNFTVILPPLARYVLETDARGFGGLMTAFGAGALAAALSMAYLSRPTERMLLGGAGAFTVLLGLLGVATSLPLIVSILVLLGFASITFTATANSRLQLLAPGELRGRVMSLYIFLFAGTAPVGSLVVGTIAEELNVQLAIAISALLCAAGVGLGFLYRARHGAASIPRGPEAQEAVGSD